MRDKTNAPRAPPAALTSNDAAIPIPVPVAVELIAASALSMPGGACRCPARRAVLGRSVSRHREYPFVERDGGAMRDAGDVHLQPVGCLGDGQRPAALNAISRNKSKREKTLGRRDRLPVGHRPERSGRAPFLPHFRTRSAQPAALPLRPAPLGWTCGFRR